ncbi:Thiolase, N-terminal domain-containing protein, partial [Xylogone sp. PMI_703]
MSSAQQRLSALGNHLASASISSGRAAILEKGPDDVVVTLAVRTPLTKAWKGRLKDTKLDDLIVALLEAVRDKFNNDPAIIDDISFGNSYNVFPLEALRAGAITAGFPVTTTTSVSRRFCSSGLFAIHNIANAIKCGDIEIGIGGGAESMSNDPTVTPPLTEKILEHPVAKDIAMPMGWTSENVAHEFNITKEAQDAYAARSFQKAETAQKEGWFKDEIIPVNTTWLDPKTKETRAVTVTDDDGIVYGTTAEKLGKIKGAFPQWPPNTTTGGNASQITDGAAAIVMMKRSKAEELGQPILARFVGAIAVGLEPRIMGIGPVPAIRKLLKRYNLTKDDIDVFEINEAFASMAVYYVEELGLDPSKVNPRGGAIALGHPLGATGARQVVTALSELRRTGKKVAVNSMCTGTGMGMAGLWVSE